MTTDGISMSRKVQQLGSSTLAVSLPADWTREQEVEKGDELVLQPDEIGGSLLLVPDQPSTADTIAKIDAGPLDPKTLERAIHTQYVLGRQLIHIQSEEPIDTALLSAVDTVENQLMGLGVVERSRTHIDIRCSVAPGDFELPKLLDRLWRTEAVIREEAIEAFLKADRAGADRALHHEAQAEKLFYLFLRLIFATYRNPHLNRTMGLETGFPLIGYRSVAQDVMLMIRCGCRIANSVEKDTLDDATVDRFRTVTDQLDEAIHAARAAVTNPTNEFSERARESIEVLDSEIGQTQQFLETERPEPVLVLQRTLSACNEMSIYATDTLEVAATLAARDASVVDTRK